MLFRALLPLVVLGIQAIIFSSQVAAQEKSPPKAPASPVNASDNQPSPEALARLADLPLKEVERAFAGGTQPEAVKMLLAIARGSRMGPGEGWFGPAATRFTWKWLTDLHGLQEGDFISADKFSGAEQWFNRLDRNKDGRITADDLDWSERNSWVQQSYLVNRLFRRIESNGDGALTRDELNKFFDAAAGGKERLTSEELRDALLSGGSTSFLPGDAPSPEMLMRGLFAGEVGSLNEGPNLNTRAPDFSLKTHDGTKTIRLADLIGKKPVVLTFGNFTCGPFRSMFPGVEEIHKRFAEEATFIAVYVREAHPTDGWKMESNAKVGVAVEQPKTFADRTAVATQCHRLLKPTMPLLVDEINDPVGHAYSGMPARLYVIDIDGNVAYKSGRGPFGFKSGEMEQALVMSLLEQKQSPQTASKQTAR